MASDKPSPFWLRVQEIGGPDQAAAILTRELGKPIDRNKVQRFGRVRMPPKAWQAALGLAEPDPGYVLPSAVSGDESEPSEPTERRAELPPRQPADAKLAPSPQAITAQARERIKALHVFVGSSVATAADPVGFQNGTGVGGGVAALWTDKSDEIAAAWVAWAEEGNRFAQSFVRLMGTGGAGGNLVIGYAALLGGTAYILGHLPDNDATRLIYGRYSRYRPADERPADESGAGDDGGQGHGAGNGTAPAGSIDSLVVTPVPPG